MKKLLSTIMAVVMLLSLVPMAVAEEGETAKWSETKSEKHVAQVGNTYYEVLYDAVAAVEENGTVTLLKNATGGGVGTYTTAGKDNLGRDKIVAKSFTLDFAGCTYTVSEPAVGSKGYESQGFHLEQGDGNVSVTLKNGTLASTGSAVKMLVQNYCNLTLDNMTLEGTGYVGKYFSNGDYVLSNNCGNVTIKDTTIVARDGDFAFDVCRYSTYPSVDVTVTGNSVINGKVEVSGAIGAGQHRQLTIEGGTFHGAFNVAKEPANITVNGGAFTDLASAVKYATDGAKITLAGDVALTSTVTVDKALTIDMNGHNITANGCRALHQKQGTLNIIGKGTIAANRVEDNSSSTIRVGDSNATNTADFTLGKDVTVTSDSCYGITYFGMKDETLTINGTVAVTGDATALSGNGSSKYKDVNVSVTVNGTVTAERANAIYKPEKGTLTINGVVKGVGGIEVKSGTLDIGANAEVTATAEATSHSVNGNGCSTSGYALAAVANKSYQDNVNITVSGGKVIGQVAKVVDDADAPEGKLTIEGGTFTVNPSAFVADKSLEVSKGTAGQYTVSKKTNAAETSEVKLPAARTEGTTEAKIDKGDIDTGKDLTVSSEVASVTINQKGVEAIGNNSDLTLTVKTVDQPNDANKAAYDEAIKGNDTASAIVVDIKLSAGSGNAFTQAVEGAYALVTVKYDASGKADKLKVFYLNGSVKQELTKVNDAANGAVNKFSYDDTNKEITMKLPHFSQYLITTTATTSGGSTSGGNSVIKTGAGSSAASTTQTVTTDLTPGSITKVTVDGKVVDAKYYTVSGSNVTFTAEFLKTLKNGSHTVTVENATKIAKGVFTVNNPTTAVQAPTTADAGIALYAGMAIASVMGTGVVFTSRKRKNH